MNTAERDGPFDRNAELDALRESVRDYCERHWSEAQVRGGIVDPEAAVRGRAWTTLGHELGLLGITVPEDIGGSGASLVESALVAEEFGRALVPLPWMSSVIAAGLLADAGETDLVRRICAADARCAVVGPVDGAWREDTPLVHAERTDQSWTLFGTAEHVVDAATADTFVVLADDGLFVVESDAAGVEIGSVPTMDTTRGQATVTLVDATARRIGDAHEAVGTVVSRAAVLMAAESVGVAERVLDLAVDYASSRVQFGRKIGSFQSVKHRCADMYVAVQAARSSTIYAAWADGLDGEGAVRDDTVLTSTLAHVSATDAARSVTADAIQIFGGIAITWEHPAHLYFKRAVADAVLWGGAQHRERLATRAIDEKVAV